MMNWASKKVYELLDNYFENYTGHRMDFLAHHVCLNRLDRPTQVFSARTLHDTASDDLKATYSERHQESVKSWIKQGTPKSSVQSAEKHDQEFMKKALQKTGACLKKDDPNELFAIDFDKGMCRTLTNDDANVIQWQLHNYLAEKAPVKLRIQWTLENVNGIKLLKATGADISTLEGVKLDQIDIGDLLYKQVKSLEEIYLYAIGKRLLDN